MIRFPDISINDTYFGDNYIDMIVEETKTQLYLMYFILNNKQYATKPS